jgi:hypothetical protein
MPARASSGPPASSVAAVDRRVRSDARSNEAFERDRTRDLNAARQRYRTLRVIWFAVLVDWQIVEDAVFAALGR